MGDHGKDDSGELPAHWGRRRAQTGKEAENEAIVLDLLNLLAGEGIPFYKRPGESKEHYTPNERLGMLRETLRRSKDESRRAREKEHEIEDREAMLLSFLGAVFDLVQQGKEGNELKDAVESALESHAHLRQRIPVPVIYGDTDNKGVQRVEVDGLAVMIQAGIGRLCHDLAPNERLCSTCGGLGVTVTTAPYRTGPRLAGEPHFPYTHETIFLCNNCYGGKVNVCDLCLNPLPRQHLLCQCPDAVTRRAKEREKEEKERRKKLPRINLKDYKEEMLWVADEDKYINVDEAEDYDPGTVFFACRPSEPDTVPSARDIIDHLNERAFDEMMPEDYDDPIEVSDEGERALQELLQEWADTHAHPRQFYYYDRNLIVEVDDG